MFRSHNVGLSANDVGLSACGIALSACGLSDRNIGALAGRNCGCRLVDDVNLSGRFSLLDRSIDGDVETLVACGCFAAFIHVETAFLGALLFLGWSGLLQIGLTLEADVGWLGEQVFVGDFQRSEVFQIEFLIIVETKLAAKQFKVVAADDEGSCFFLAPGHVGVALHFGSVLVGFVEIAESRHFHQVQLVDGLQLDVKITNDEGREIETSHLEEQLILIEGIGVVGDDVEELLVAVGGKLFGGYGVAVVEHGGAAAPHVGEVELSAVQTATSLHSVDYHAGHLANATAGEVLHHEIHVFQTSVGIVVVETAQTTNKYEFVAVGSQRETGFRHMGIAVDFFVAVGLEGAVGGGVERIFDVLAPFRILHIVAVGEHGRPLTVGEFLTQLLHITVGDKIVSFAGMEQEKMVVYFVHLLKVWIVLGETVKLFLAEGEVVEFVLEDNARVEKTI